jgi:hypothetical protein
MNMKPKTREKSKQKQSTVYDQYLAANPKMTDYVTGSGVMPENATREEQDVAQIYQSAYANEQAINKRADNAIFDANKAHDLSAKYLAVQNEANGLGGLGIADTSSLRLSSQYQKALAEANATRESALQDNYSKMQEDVQTVRGEWASQEEAKKQTKYDNASSFISGVQDKSSVEAYLKALGFNEETEEYGELMAQWEAGKAARIGETILGYDDREAVDRYLNANGITEETPEYDDYMKEWELAYGAEEESTEKKEVVLRDGVSFNDNGKFLFFGQDNFKDGDNFSIKVGEDILRIQSGGEVSDEAIKEAAQDVANQTVFGYDGKIYYKVNGNVYLVERRDNSYREHYETLYDLFFGNGEKNSSPNANYYTDENGKTDWNKIAENIAKGIQNSRLA